LRHHMPGVFNIKVSVRPEDAEGIALCEKFNVEALRHPVYVQSPGKKLNACGARAGFDVANRHDLLIKASTSDWVVLSHMDVIWTSDMMPKIKPYMTDEYGVLSHHPGGCLAVNRKAYGECHAGFWNYSFRGDYYDDPRCAWLRLAGVFQAPDPGGRNVSIPSVDVGCMLEIEMQSYTYKVLREAMHYCLYHIGGGSYHGIGGVANFFDEPMTEAGLACHKVIYDSVQKALTDFAMFKGNE